MQSSYAKRTLIAVLLTSMMIVCPIPATALTAFNEGFSVASSGTEQPTTPAKSGLLTTLDVWDEEGAEQSSRNLRGPLGNSNHVDATGYNNQRKLLRDSSNTLQAVFSKNGEIHYTNSTDGGITWVGTKVLSGTTTAAKHPSMAISGNHFYFVWEDDGNISFRRTPDRGLTWVPPLNSQPIVLKSNFTNKPRTPVVAATNLDLVIAWSGFDPGKSSYEIQYVRSSNNGSTFNPISQLTTQGKMASMPTISANGTSYYLAYHMGDNPTREIWSRTSVDSGSNWNAAVNVSKNAGDSINPSIVSNGTNLFIVWIDINANNPEVLFKKSIDGGASWSANAQLISENPTNSYGPMISIVSTGDIYVVWYDNYRHSHNDTFMRRYNSSSSTWEPRFQCTDLDEGYSYHAVNPYSAMDRVEYIFTVGRQPTYTVYYGYHSTLPNSQPTLTWTGEDDYKNSGLFPEAGHTTANIYTFRINYSDADNNEPLNGVHVLVDYNQDGRFNWYDNLENYPMLQAEPWDTDYRDGKIYSWAMKYPGLGKDYKYRFYAMDSANNLATGVGMEEYGYPDINIVDHEPRLFWTNEKGYSSDGVEPATGTSSTNFTWHVSYFHQDNNLPFLGYPKVLIDVNNDTFYTLDEYFNMTELDPDDKACDDGKFYTYSMTLPSVGLYTYRIIAQDLWEIPNPPTDKPSLYHDGPEVTTINTAPTVTYPQETGFSDNGLDPNSGSTSREFTFKIIYTDNENNAPAKGYPKVWLDLNLDNSFSETEKFTMSAENASDIQYNDGKVYYYDTFFPTVGTYKYRFEARDSWDQQAVGPTVGQQTGPDITKSNDAPTLTYPTTEGYVTDGVNPDKGRDTTRFTFRVVYTDKNNDAPLLGYPTVWVDKDLDKVKDTDEVVKMTEVDQADTVFDDGKLYTYSIILGKNGRFSYQFDAWDGSDGHATGAATKLVGGPDVASNWNNGPRLEWVGSSGFTTDGVDPDSGANTQIFTYKINYVDYDNDTPLENYPKIYLDLTGNGDYNETNERQILWEEDKNDTDFTVGKVFMYVTDLSTAFTEVGTRYFYMFVAQDSKGADALGRPTQLTYGPNITSGNSKPDLLWAGTLNYEGDGLHPEAGNTTQEFVYKVKYVDADNDPPLAGYPKVFLDNDIIGRMMTKENAADDGYSTGVIYVYKTTLNLGANHRYRFLAFDQYNTKASAGDAPMQTSDGPVVENNNPPVLTWTTDGKYKLGVSSAKATLGKKTTFKVVYSDIEGDRPLAGYPRLLIDQNGDGDFTDALESLEMIEESGDFKTGKVYSIGLLLEKGKHTYKFEARDAKGNTATGDPTQVQETGVKVSAAPASQGLGTIMILVFVILIVVVAVVGFIVGKKMGGSGKKPEKKEESQPAQGTTPAPGQPAQQYDQQGYAYDPNQAAYQYQYPPDQAAVQPQPQDVHARAPEPAAAPPAQPPVQTPHHVAPHPSTKPAPSAPTAPIPPTNPPKT